MCLSVGVFNIHSSSATRNLRRLRPLGGLRGGQAGAAAEENERGLRGEAAVGGLRLSPQGAE